MLHELPRQKLGLIVERSGPGVCHDEAQCRSALEADCPQYPDEIAALCAAVHERIPVFILDHIGQTPRSPMIAGLAMSFANDTGLDLAHAKWTVEAWTAALERLTHERRKQYRDKAGVRAISRAARSTPQSLTTASAPPEAERAHPPGTGDLVMQTAIRMAMADDYISIEEITALSDISKELGLGDEIVKHLVHEESLKGAFHDQLTALVWAIFTPKERRAIHMGMKIPPKLRKMAVVRCRVPASETVVSLIDCTRSGSGRSAVILTDTALFYCNGPESPRPGPGVLKYRSFLVRDFRARTRSTVDLDQGTVVDLGESGVDPAHFATLLYGIKSLALARQKALNADI